MTHKEARPTLSPWWDMMWFILLPRMDNGIRTLIGTPRGFLCRRWLLRWIKEEPCTARDCSIKRSDERKKLMVAKVEIRMCRGCDSLVSLQREIEKKVLCNTPTPVTGSRYPLHWLFVCVAALTVRRRGFFQQSAEELSTTVTQSQDCGCLAEDQHTANEAFKVLG